MNGALVILLILVVPYLAWNVRRLILGRRWAFGVCTLAKEWEQREHDKLLARRAAERA
ncbi:MAG TPA: hypothetical protein VL120_12185 [Solirubrobacteraceae bacterium]|jgi:hypothetical protein|nr:hypothetical protein [Solirubrobacteraceae bacterium]